jgi:hypothetical protein
MSQATNRGGKIATISLRHNHVVWKSPSVVQLLLLEPAIFVREVQPDQTSTNLLANFLLAFRASLLVGPQWDRFIVLF